jgi:heme a synthase
MNLSTHPHKKIIYWLFFTAFMVFCMAIIGAITRLTESGLSMVEWRPLIGAIPPLTQAEWDRVFHLYQQTPEYIHKNSWMGLEDFKYIFFWEWFHRFWGRLIGLVYGLPLLWFAIKRQIPKGYGLKFLALLFLGGLQAVLGWYMVMSGLVNEPTVSHFRLASHLSLALFIFCCLVWLAFDLIHKHTPPAPMACANTPARLFCLKRHGWITFFFIALTIIWGAFVAGRDGGMLYNTWPMMDAHWIPPEVTGFYAITHDPAAIQFFHRWIAILTTLVVLSFSWRVKNVPLAGMIILQVLLGIGTILMQVWIPIAALHQAGAIVLLFLMVRQMKILHDSPAPLKASS